MLNAMIRDITMPPRMARRPVSEKGFPVPWFVSMIKGKWDFVNIDPRKYFEAYKRRICWLCGEPLGQYACFVIGPMCAINRVSAEPATHRDCAEYAVKACPFLARPNMKRNDAAALAPISAPGAVEHNPGATLIWVTKSYIPFRNGQGLLFQLGEPVETLWFAEGRTATRAEIDAAIAKGMPLLRKAAELDGPEGIAEMEACVKRAEKLLPVA